MPRPASHHSPRGGSSKNQWAPVIVAALSITLLVGVCGLAYLFYMSQKHAVRTDPMTLCAVDQAPAEVLAILIDVSDSFTEAQRVDVLNLLDRARRSLPKQGRLEIYTLSPDAIVLSRPILSLCNPGDGSDLNVLYQNPKIAEQVWDTGFRKKVDELLQTLVLSPESTSSPIFEAIQSISLFSFGAADRDGVPKKLVIASDMLQNLPGKYSQYTTGALTFSTFRNDPYYSSVKSDLSGVDVSIFYLDRPTPRSVQGINHVLFWEQYFADQGASLGKVRHVFGAK